MEIVSDAPAMSSPPPYFGPLNVGNVIHDLGHLDPIRFQVPSEKLKRDLKVRCRFSNHTFTRSFDNEPDIATSLIIMDGPRQRVFCPERYQLSLHLPEVITRLRFPQIYVHQTTHRRNWLYVAAVDICSDGSTAATHYQTFFTIRKASGDHDVREDLEMVVESAYASDGLRPPALLGRMLFTTLSTLTVQGKPIHTGHIRNR